MSDLRASVIIPVWKGRRYIGACLDALLAQEPSCFEVIAVDNASADGSAEFVAQHYPQVNLIRNQENLGFAGACNIGIRTGRGEILILLNQDTRVCPGWLAALLDAFQDPRVGAAGCKILYPDGATIQHAGGWIEWPLGLARHYGHGEQDAGQWDQARQVEYTTGAALAFRGDLLGATGLLDERFWPGYFEDADLCFRVREAGYEVWYVPQAVVRHEETTSLAGAALVSEAYQRGRLRFVLKHLPPERFLSEFVPAEQAYQPPAIRSQESTPLRRAYLEAMVAAPHLLRSRWRADEQVSAQIILALRQLYQKAWDEDWNRVEEWAAAAVAPFVPAGPPGVEPVPGGAFRATTPSLADFRFRSTVPVLGGLIAHLRSLWYNVAARWVIQQQEAINRQHGIYIRALEERLAALAAENALLAQDMARLILDSEPGGSNDNGRSSS